VTAVVPPNTTATFKPPQVTDKSPSVSLEAREVELVTTDGGQTYSLSPGRYRLVVQ